jgi:hypothetical protein
MRWKYLISVCVLTVAVGHANADTIDFSQFGPKDTTLSSPLIGTTTGGVSVTLTSPNNTFVTFVEQSHAFGNGTWEGTFPSGAPLLWDGNGPGLVTLMFATPIQSLTLAAQANNFGNFVETMQAFNASNTLLDTEISPTIFNCADLSCEGTQAFLTLVGLNVTRVTVSTTNDGAGFALYGGAGASPVPLPGALPLFAGGLGIISLLAKGRKRKNAAIAAA